MQVTGEADAYTAYVESSWSRLFRTAYALTGEVRAAEELLQSTLVRVYLKWRKVEQAENRDAYVRRVMVNQATSGWRSRSRRREVLTDAPRSPRAEGEGFETDLARSDALWSEVRRLPPRQRAVVVLRYYEDLSEREIADVLGIAPGTVKSQASAALRGMRARLAPESTSPPSIPSTPSAPRPTLEESR